MNIVIVLYLMIYSVYCNREKTEKDNYLYIAGAILGHNVFGMVTEITVNSRTVPPVVNDICHILFFICSIIFAVEFLRYVLSNILTEKEQKRYMKIAYLVSAVGIIILCFSDIIYIQGNGTAYSAGEGATACFAVAMIMLFIADVLLVKHYRIIARNTLYTVLPISVLVMVFMIAQIVIPEFLLTESSATLIAIALFFSMENPVKRIQDQAFVDYNTGLYNRNCYEHDVKQWESIERDEDVCVVICDLNCLKYINDTYGHLEGDKRIAAAAKVLRECLRGASKIYRTGGDEFFALYKGRLVPYVPEETLLIQDACKKCNLVGDVPFEIAVGYAKWEAGESINEVVKRADEMMYENKKMLKEKSNVSTR